MTDTPRTDALHAEFCKLDNGYGAMVDYARTLERELAMERGFLTEAGKALTEAKRALSDVNGEQRASFEAGERKATDALTGKLKDALIAYYQEDGDETAARAIHRAEDFGALVRQIVHDIGTAEAMAVSAGCDAEAAIRRADKAEGDLVSATQPLAPEMRRLNERVIALNAENLRLRETGSYAVSLEKALAEIAEGLNCRTDEDAHYCPNCDNSLYNLRALAHAALAKVPKVESEIGTTREELNRANVGLADEVQEFRCELLAARESLDTVATLLPDETFSRDFIRGAALQGKERAERALMLPKPDAANDREREALGMLDEPERTLAIGTTYEADTLDEALRRLFVNGESEVTLSQECRDRLAVEVHAALAPEFERIRADRRRALANLLAMTAARDYEKAAHQRTIDYYKKYSQGTPQDESEIRALALTLLRHVEMLKAGGATEWCPSSTDFFIEHGRKILGPESLETVPRHVSEEGGP